MAASKILALCAMVACAATSAPSPAQLQSFPSRPLRVIVPFPPGGSADDVMRILSNRLAQLTGQNVILDNRPGASGNVGTDLAARAAADGHTLLATTLPLVVNPSLFAHLNHDVVRDFAPVSLIAVAPFVLVVHPSLPASSVKELIAYARVRPGELNYASAGGGTISTSPRSCSSTWPGSTSCTCRTRGAAPRWRPCSAAKPISASSKCWRRHRTRKPAGYVCWA